MESSVSVRVLRENLSRYLERVKAGEAFVVTERGNEVARLTPSGAGHSGLARLIAERRASIPRGALHCRVVRRLISVCAQEVADGDMAELVLAACRADVQVMGARALRRLGEEVVVGRLRGRGEQVSQPLQRRDVPLQPLDGRDGELKVEDRLGRKPRHRRRAHVLQADGLLAQRLRDAKQLRRGQSRPGRIVVHDAHGRVEAVVQRRMPLHAHRLTVPLPERTHARRRRSDR